MRDTSSATLRTQHCLTLPTIRVRWTLINMPPFRVAAEAAAAAERCETRVAVPRPLWSLALLLVTLMSPIVKVFHRIVFATVLLQCSPGDATWAPEQGKQTTGAKENMVIRM